MSITSTVISLSTEEILGLAKPIMIETNAIIKRKLIKNTLKWPGLNGLDLAKTVSTKNKFSWKGFKTWTKENGYKKIKKKN